MPQLMSNVQNNDPLAALKLLLQPNAADPSTASNNLGPATLQQLSNVGASTGDAIGPYQQGVAKALKDLGIKHAQDAVASGVNPMDIQNHDIMQPAMSMKNGGVGTVDEKQIDPTQLLAGIIGLAKSSNSDSSQEGNVTTPQDASNNGNSPSQNSNFGYKPDNPISSFFNMLGITPTPEAQVLLTEAAMNRQKIAAGQPADIAVPQAQAAALNQKIAGAEPIQPKDIADLNRQTYSATIQAANDAWQRNNDEISKMQEQYKNLQEGRSGFSKGIGGQTQQMKALQNVIVEKMKQNQQHMSNLQTIMANPPKAVETQQQNSPFQVGQQYNGETIKNVRRIK